MKFVYYFNKTVFIFLIPCLSDRGRTFSIVRIVVFRITGEQTTGTTDHCQRCFARIIFFRRGTLVCVIVCFHSYTRTAADRIPDGKLQLVFVCSREFCKDCLRARSIPCYNPRARDPDRVGRKICLLLDHFSRLYYFCPPFLFAGRLVIILLGTKRSPCNSCTLTFRPQPSIASHAKVIFSLKQ